MPTHDQFGGLQALLCLASTVDDGSINVNITGVAPAGTSAFAGLNISNNDSGQVPTGWSSFTVTNDVTSNDIIGVDSVILAPGMSIAHGTWDGFPGAAISVITSSGATATLTWTIPTVTP